MQYFYAYGKNTTFNFVRIIWELFEELIGKKRGDRQMEIEPPS